MDTEEGRARGGEGIRPGLVALLSVAAAATVANLYYVQPLLPEVARGFEASPRAIGWVLVLMQVGYALGLLLFIPLGDAVERRRLILSLVGASALALAATALAPGPAWLAGASFLVGFFTVVPHVAVPLAAHLATPKERGRVIGLVMGGVLVGILLARTVSGFVGGALGWRAVYLLAAAAMVALGASLWLLLPPSPPERAHRYLPLLASLFTLVREEGELRQASIIGGMVFGAFSVFWTTLAFFLEGPPYHAGAEAAGLFGLVGVAGALAAPLVGRLSDRRGPRFATGVALAVALLSFGVFLALGRVLWGLVAGVVLLDVGVQSAHVSNLARVHALDPAARSRRNTVYMVSYFVGGALGTWLGVRAWTRAGWTGVSLAGAGFVLAALAAWGSGARLFSGARPRTRDAVPPR